MPEFIPYLPFSVDDAWWRFDTARFAVTFHATEEDCDPADQFADEQDLAFAREGGAHWFTAWVVVWELGDSFYNAKPLAYDVLGGCSYNSFREFYSSHRDSDPENRNCSLMRAARGDVTICHYFPGMVREAVAQAKVELIQRRALAGG